MNKEKDKSFLLDFSHDIASARTKNELSVAIHSSLKKLSEVRAYFIRVLNDDGKTMSPFMHDDDIDYANTPSFKKLLNTKIPIDNGITEPFSCLIGAFCVKTIRGQNNSAKKTKRRCLYII